MRPPTDKEARSVGFHDGRKRQLQRPTREQTIYRERLVDYRTECVIGHNAGLGMFKPELGADLPSEVLDWFEAEYRWADGELDKGKQLTLFN